MPSIVNKVSNTWIELLEITNYYSLIGQNILKFKFNIANNSCLVTWINVNQIRSRKVLIQKMFLYSWRKLTVKSLNIITSWKILIIGLITETYFEKPRWNVFDSFMIPQGSMFFTINKILFYKFMKSTSILIPLILSMF